MFKLSIFSLPYSVALKYTLVQLSLMSWWTAATDYFLVILWEIYNQYRCILFSNHSHVLTNIITELVKCLLANKHRLNSKAQTLCSLKGLPENGSDPQKAVWGLTERHLAGEHTEAACRSSKHRGLLWDLLLKQTSTDDRGMSCS